MAILKIHTKQDREGWFSIAYEVGDSNRQEPSSDLRYVTYETIIAPYHEIVDEIYSGCQQGNIEEVHFAGHLLTSLMLKEELAKRHPDLKIESPIKDSLRSTVSSVKEKATTFASDLEQKLRELCDK